MTKMLSGIAAAVIISMGLNGAPGQTTTSQAQVEHQKRIREHQERVSKIIKEAAEKRGASQSNPAPADKEVTSGPMAETSPETDTTSDQSRYRLEGWRKFWEFYKTPYDGTESVSYRGERQSYSDDEIEIKWHLEIDDGNSTPTRTISYRWKKFSDDEAMVGLPADNGYMLLARNGRSYVIEYASKAANGVAINSYRQKSANFLANSVFAPLASGMVRPSAHDILKGQGRTNNAVGYIIGPTQTQIVNEWAFFIQDGQVYAEPAIDSRHYIKKERIRIGSAVNDHRPVGDMMVRIEKMDPLTSSAEVVISEAIYPHTLFATDRATSISKVVQSAGGVEATKLEVLDEVSQHYGFAVRWVDEKTRRLAEHQRVKAMRSTIYSRNDAVLNWIDELLGSDFIAIAVSHETVSIELSREKVAEEEFARLTQQLHRDVRLVTKLYSVKRLADDQAILVLQRDFLSCYTVMKPETTDTTSETVVARGDIWAIVKRPIPVNYLEQKSKKSGEGESASVCESIDNNNTFSTSEDGGQILVVTATAETHERIAAWLKDIEAEAKQASVSEAAQAPVPERRRLQVVLLQGGKSGEPATIADESGTTVTYQADVPGQFGMTPEDLKVLGFDGAVVAGRGIVNLVAQPGNLGQSRLMLGERFGFTVQFLQEQSGLLVIEAAIESEDKKQPLAQNTMILERGKPSFLGVTNLSGAVIVVVTWD